METCPSSVRFFREHVLSHRQMVKTAPVNRIQNESLQIDSHPEFGETTEVPHDDQARHSEGDKVAIRSDPLLPEKRSTLFSSSPLQPEPPLHAW